MKLRTRRFPIPTTFDQLEVGQPFGIYSNGGRHWTCIRLEVDCLILGGSEIAGEEFPAFYDVRKLGGQIVRLVADGFVLTPSSYDGDIEFAVPTEDHHGALAMDVNGRAMVRVKPSEMRREGFVDLSDGSHQQENADVLVYYPSWELAGDVGGRLWTVYSRSIKKGVSA